MLNQNPMQPEFETQEAFKTAIRALKNDYMFMHYDEQYLHFKHIDTREYIRIPNTSEFINLSRSM